MGEQPANAVKAAIREPEISRTILGDPCTLEACPPGLFIADAYNTLGMKSEYRTEQGAIEAYIVESGEFFWGDNPQTVERQRAQIVRPISHADAILNLAPVGGRGEETAWLIERQDLAPYPLYMRQTPRGHSWTPDPNEAARFATKEQASAECCGGDERGPLKVTEHMWCAAPPPQQEQGGMK